MRGWQMAATALVLGLAGGAHAQSCMQSFDVDPAAAISTTPGNGVYAGMNCVDAELYRENLFVQNRGLLEDGVLSRANDWIAFRSDLVARLEAAEAAYAQAVADERESLARDIIIYEVSMVAAAFGCSSTGPGAWACVIGVLAAKADLIASLANQGGASDAIRSQLGDLRATVASADALSDADLGRALQTYRSEAGLLCGVIQRECLR